MVRQKPDNNQEKLLRRIVVSRRQRMALFLHMSLAEQGELLLKLSPRVRKYIMGNMNSGQIVGMLNYLDPDKATKLLRLVDRKKAAVITSNLASNTRKKVEFLLRFNSHAAAGLMNLDYVEVEHTSRFKDIFTSLIDHEKTTGKFPTILSIHEGKLMGELPGHELAIRNPDQLITPYVKQALKLPFNSPENSVVQKFLQHPHKKMVVLDEGNSVLGIINTDDVIALISTHTPGSLYRFAGVDREEDAFDSAWTKVSYRYKWLIINLGTAFLAASVVGLFEDVISKFVLLAIYMPIVAGMGGNAGTQTLAVAIRGLTLKEIDFAMGRRFILNEMIAGGINGVINGIIVAGVATFFNHSPMLGVVIGVAMVVNLIIAGFFGALIPMIMKALKKDPASSATIFITTATDVLGFFVFLGLASILLV